MASIISRLHTTVSLASLESARFRIRVKLALKYKKITLTLMFKLIPIHENELIPIRRACYPKKVYHNRSICTGKLREST